MRATCCRYTLQKTPLSEFLEAKLAAAQAAGRLPAGRAGCIRVRVVSNVARTATIPAAVAERYARAKELPYMHKNIFAFYEAPDGSEIFFFALMVQEYGSACPFPNTSTAYVSYLDSNQLYHCPTCAAHHDSVGCDCWSPDGAPLLLAEAGCIRVAQY